MLFGRSIPPRESIEFKPLIGFLTLIPIAFGDPFREKAEPGVFHRTLAQVLVSGSWRQTVSVYMSILSRCGLASKVSIQSPTPIRPPECWHTQMVGKKIFAYRTLTGLVRLSKASYNQSFGSAQKGKGPVTHMILRGWRSWLCARRSSRVIDQD